VVLEEQLLAVVNINVKKERKPLSEGEIKTLFFILNITAPVIKNANSYTSLHSELKYNVKRLKRIIDETTVALSSALELKDPYTAGHQKRVSKLASDIAKKMGLPDNVVESVCVAGMLHDIGKIYVPSEILSKPSKLSHPETSIIRTHPEVGYEILNSIEFPWAIADIVYQSHERLNGSGYPRGLKGDEILLESRILAVADVVEAMSSHRPYRASLGLDSAIAEIKKGAGVLYDSEVVKACLKLYNEKSFKFI
jgi:putative nucleotidyltransferase with HDIG domain